MFWRFSIERRAGRGSIAGGCCGEVFWGIIVSEKSSSSSFVMGFSADPASSHGGGSRRQVEPQISSQESRGISFPHAQKLPPSIAMFQIGSLWWELVSCDARRNPFASLPPCARLRLGCLFVPEKLQRLFLAIVFVLDQAKLLQSKWGCCFALRK